MDQSKISTTRHTPLRDLKDECTTWMNKGQSNTRPPLFDGKYYSRWKAIMDNLLMAEDYEIWNIILGWPNIPIKLDVGGREVQRKEVNLMILIVNSWRKMPKPTRYLFLVWALMSTTKFVCSVAKKIWDTLPTPH